MAQAGASLRSLALLSLFLTASGIIQQQQSCSIIHTASGQTIRFDAWGQNSVLVQAFPAGFQPSGLPLTALLQRPKLGNSACELQDRFSNGELLVEVENERLVFRRVSDMALLFQESGPRTFEPSGYRVDDFALNVSFSSDENEALYGLGQHKTGRLNYKNLTLPLQPKNTEIFIPLLHSSRGYSYLFDYPGYGTFTSGQNTTAWAAQAAKQMTLWVTTAASNSSRGAIAEAMDTYLDVTGRPPLYPYWTTGFWQSRNRYRTQDEVLSIAREYVNRSLPLSLIVIDYYSWSVLGDETFNPDCWPDPKGLVSELKQLGVNLMVSPYFHEISNTSHRYAAAKSRGLLALDNQTRTPAAVGFGSVPGQAIYLYDVFQEEAREYMWQAVADTYEDYGVAALWLDCDEPCGKIPPSGLSYCRGTCDDVAVGDLYPWLITAAINPHPKASDPIVTLGRSTWAGGQRYGAAVWSGDTRSTFADLNQQFRAGLNVALSGVTYWTTDIGGYSGGNTTDPEFRELIVRWFQWGAFCPLFRLHGCRQRDTQSETNDDCGPASCGDNEVWSFGDTALSAITKVMFLRESLRNYTYQQFSTAVEEGLPVIRPLFLEFPADKQAANIDDEQMFGPDYLVAPIMAYGARGRHVYLPSGSQWTDHFGGQTHAGGQVVVWSGPLDEFPLFKRV